MNTFSTIEELPQLTKTGWNMVKVPSAAWNLINSCWYYARKRATSDDLLNNREGVKSKLYDIGAIEDIPYQIIEMLRPMHEEWCGEELVSSVIYGIREYENGSLLPIHTDHLSSHHVASSITIGYDKKWYLDFQSHDGELGMVDIKPAGMFMYEAAKCRHARTKPFEGKYFRNLYVHYKLKNWEYVPK